MPGKKKPAKKVPVAPAADVEPSTSQQIHDALVAIDSAFGRIAHIATSELARLRHGGK
ncbi:MAG TPA: hypothetical protein VIN37_02905 [Candidatus Limnocylindria bacterium]